jgi:hypothetical protein
MVQQHKTQGVPLTQPRVPPHIHHRLFHKDSSYHARPVASAVVYLRTLFSCNPLPLEDEGMVTSGTNGILIHRTN